MVEAVVCEFVFGFGRVGGARARTAYIAVRGFGGYAS
jgi:hypothetical protein